MHNCHWLTASNAVSVCTSILLNANYLARVMRVHTLFLSVLPSLNRVPKCHSIGMQVQSYVDSGLDCILQLVARLQRLGDFPPLLSIVWSLFRHRGYSSCVLLGIFGEHSLDLGHETGTDGYVLYDPILRKSPGHCHIWHVTKSSNCQPCLNFDVYTVDMSCMLPCRLDKLLVVVMPHIVRV